jgi:hypothetical protein
MGNSLAKLNKRGRNGASFRDVDFAADGGGIGGLWGVLGIINIGFGFG